MEWICYNNKKEKLRKRFLPDDHHQSGTCARFRREAQYADCPYASWVWDCRKRITPFKTYSMSHKNKNLCNNLAESSSTNAQARYSPGRNKNRTNQETVIDIPELRIFWICNIPQAMLSVPKYVEKVQNSTRKEMASCASRASYRQRTTVSKQEPQSDELCERGCKNVGGNGIACSKQILRVLQPAIKEKTSKKENHLNPSKSSSFRKEGE